MQVKCLNCGHEFEAHHKQIVRDDLGWHTSCPQCEGSFDVDVTVLPTGALVKAFGDWVGVIDGNDAEESENFVSINYFVCPLEIAEESDLWSEAYQFVTASDLQVVQPMWERYREVSK